MVAAKVEESEGRLMDFQNIMVCFCLTWGVGMSMSKVIARWSEMVRSMLARLLMVMSEVCCVFQCQTIHNISSRYPTGTNLRFD